MRTINFKEATYTLMDGVKVYDGPGKIDPFEMIWTGVNVSSKKLDKKGHKINKRLREALKAISDWKDADKDSRILLSGPQILVLEEDEYSLLKSLLDEVNFRATLSEEVAEMYDLIDNAQFTKPSDLTTNK